MATKKQPEVVARRVWRMTADSPMGEYLELVPKESQDEAPAAPKRTFHPETPPSYTAVATPYHVRGSAQRSASANHSPGERTPTCLGSSGINTRTSSAANVEGEDPQASPGRKLAVIVVRSPDGVSGP